MERTTTSTRRAGPAGNGQPAGTLRLEPPHRKVQVSQLLIAVFLVAVSALTAAVLFSRAAAREPVLALASPVERGQVVVASDLMLVYVATDEPVATLTPDAMTGLVGLTAVADLDAGTILTSAHFVSRSVLDTGEGVVGLALSPGEYPTPLLAPGDIVNVVVTGGRSSDPTADSEVVVLAAEVFDITDLGTQGDRFVSLRMSSEAATEVAGAAAGDRVRLVLVSGATP